MLMARINLGLEVTKTCLMDMAERIKLERKDIEDPKGTAHRHFVRKTFRRDRCGYKQRIIRLVERAANARARMIQLPAISLLVDDHVTLADYCRAFPAKPFVVAGLYDATKRGYKTDTREGSVVLENGAVLKSFPTDCHKMWASPGKLGQVCTIVAVSSTVKHVRTDTHRPYRSDWFGSETSADRVLVLDLGHEQYSGRYKKTLVSVHRHIRESWGSKSVVVLAQWRYFRSSGTDPWLVPEGIRTKRLDPQEDHAGPYHDEIDLITLPVW